MQNVYKIKSLNVVTYLRMKDIPIVKVEKENGDAVFSFEKTNELFTAINEYNSNDELKKFIFLFKEVRTIAKSLK